MYHYMIVMQYINYRRISVVLLLLSGAIYYVLYHIVSYPLIPTPNYGHNQHCVNSSLKGLNVMDMHVQVTQSSLMLTN